MKDYVYCAVNKEHKIVEVCGSSRKTTYFKTDKYLKKAVEYQNKYHPDDPWAVVKFQLVPENCMVFFSARMWIEKEFEKWCEEKGVKKCPNSLVAFMDIKGYLKAEDIMNDWRESKNEL